MYWLRCEMTWQPRDALTVAHPIDDWLEAGLEPRECVTCVLIFPENWIFDRMACYLCKWHRRLKLPNLRDRVIKHIL